ncbi:hypothetical protein ACTHRI_05385 [Microbacterium algihabitans]
MSPESVSPPQVADRRERQRAWIRLARERLSAFVLSSAGEVDAASREAETALRGAVSSGAAIETISAELEVSPRALKAIVDGSVPLRSLHPDDSLRPA